ncbi:transposase, Mutator family protein [Mycobacterium ulcerans str. Harvey]|uniref:Mutator family transposase n=1 Tax=Mycobacterium ulcerans str. Harvey TaxID=1299332 RepID=A0ABP3ABX3_MYCUL|nr:transposase, Mutator family protein [Mycobacterium ulcerans str. Harvey]
MGHRYPAAIRLWRNAWNEFIPFLDYDTEIRKVICSTNAIESLNARYRRAIRARGHFPPSSPPEMPILGHPVARSNRNRTEAMDDALETSIERLRDHLRRPHARKRNHLTENAAYTVNQTDPRSLARRRGIRRERVGHEAPYLVCAVYLVLLAIAGLGAALFMDNLTHVIEVATSSRYSRCPIRGQSRCSICAVRVRSWVSRSLSARCLGTTSLPRRIPCASLAACRRDRVHRPLLGSLSVLVPPSAPSVAATPACSTYR